MPKAAQTTTTKSYKELSDRLDEALAWFDSQELDLDQATKKYQEAMSLILEMEQYIKRAEIKIKHINTKLKT